MRIIMLAAMFFAAAVPSVSAKEVPASPATYVYNEGILKNPEVISKQLAAFEKQTGHQFVVAFFNGLDGDSLEGYSNKLFKTWKIGDRKRNDGLLFAAFLGDRKWRVEVGYGFEGKLTDMQAYDIATAAAVPYFKKGDFDAGVAAVVAALQTTLTTPEPGAAPATKLVMPPIQEPAPAADDFPVGILFAVLGAFGCLGFFAWIAMRRKADDYNEFPTVAPRRQTLYIPPTPMVGYTPAAKKSKPSKSSCKPPKRGSSDDDDSSRRSSYSPPSYDSGSSSSGGSDSGFSGGGGDSGGGGASGGW